MFEKVLDNRSGQVIMSIILGLGLAVMFSRACSGRNCIIVRGPNPNTVDGKIYQFGGDCYNFKPNMTACSVDKKPIKIE